MDRRSFLRLTGTGVAAATFPGLLGEACGQGANRPNIVLIMADDLGYGHLGCYGQDKIATPNIDALARRGVKFTDAYAGCSLCAPSRSVLMTGLHAGHTPVRGNDGGIPLRGADITMAEVLKKAGYTTGLFGKWGLGDAGTTGEPNDQGFDEFFGYLHQKHAHFYYTDYLWHNKERHLIPENRHAKAVYTPDLILEKALDFLDTPREEPFFCFLSTTIPHHEWIAPEEDVAKYAHTFEDEPPPFRWRQGYALPDKPKATFAAMVSHMDEGVGKIISLLEERSLTENTLVIFTSDNGADRYSLANPDFFQANGLLRGFKGELYEGGLRVPAVAAWPGHVRENSISDHPWYFADLLPTFAQLAGTPETMPDDCDGLSIAPLLYGTTKGLEEHEFMYWELGTGENLYRALRMENWKAVWPKPDAPVELYDLDADIGEAANVADANPGQVRKMKRIMNQQHEEAPPQLEPNAPDGMQHQ